VGFFATAGKFPRSRAAEPAPAVAQVPPAPPDAPEPPPPLYKPSAPDFELSRHVKFDGQLRFRYEYFDPFTYTAAGVSQADDYVLMRTRLGALFTLHPRLSARFQIQDSRIWGEEGVNTPANPVGSVTSSTDRIDIHQAYIDLTGLLESAVGPETLSLRVGRQELSYGDQRLISPLDWSNVARAWDAVKLSIEPPEAPGGLAVDVFASIIRDTASARTGGGPDPAQVDEVGDKQGFYGAYAMFEDIRLADGWTWETADRKVVPVLAPHQLDLYALYRDLADGAFTAEDGQTGDVQELTLGTRVAGKLFRDEAGRGFDWSGEIASQLGDFAGDDISAYGYAVTAGYTFVVQPLDATKVRLGAEYDYGSGDSDPNDGDHETFDPLFPFGHYYQGIQDTFSWKNGRDLAFKLDVYPPKRTGIPHAEVQYHLFWLSENEDGWFNAGLGQIRRDPTGSADSFVGTEIDFTIKYLLVDPFAVLWVGYARFFPGEYVKDTGEDPDRDFIFAQLAVTF
jgi:hypothetical protein